VKSARCLTYFGLGRTEPSALLVFDVYGSGRQYRVRSWQLTYTGRGEQIPVRWSCLTYTGRGSLRPPAASRCSARSSLRAPSRGDPPLKDPRTGTSMFEVRGSTPGHLAMVSARGSVVSVLPTDAGRHMPLSGQGLHRLPRVDTGVLRERLGSRQSSWVLKRGVAAGRSAQRGTSGAATGGGGPQAPPTRIRQLPGTHSVLFFPTRIRQT
jgi:hypothetical protein